MTNDLLLSWAASCFGVLISILLFLIYNKIKSYDSALKGLTDSLHLLTIEIAVIKTKLEATIAVTSCVADLNQRINKITCDLDNFYKQMRDSEKEFN